MRATPITPNVMQLTRFRFVNAYLVREEDGFTLIDTTMRGAAGDLIAAAESAGGTIRRVALTHGHALKDRVGSSVEVLMPELDARIHAGEYVVDGKLPGSWPELATSPDVWLAAGDRVGSLEVVASPGHSPGHVAFLDTRDRALIGGDVFTTYGKAAVTSHFYLRFPFAAMATWDKAADVEAARTLRALEPALLAVGHGPALRDPVAAMDAAIELAASKLAPNA